MPSAFLQQRILQKMRGDAPFSVLLGAMNMLENIA